MNDIEKIPDLVVPEAVIVIRTVVGRSLGVEYNCFAVICFN